MKIPATFDYGEFFKSDRTGIFLRKRNSRDFRFRFLKFEETRSSTLKNNRAFFVVQSWVKKGKEKVLFSGLRKFGKNCLYGDNLFGKKKSFFVLIGPKEGILKMYYFPSYLPRKKKDFVAEVLLMERKTS